MRALTLLSVSALALTTLTLSAHAEAPMRVCTAGKDGNYFAFASLLQKTLRGSVDVEPIATDGSWANLGKLKNGECDAAIVQSDAENVYKASNAGSSFQAQRLGVLFKETLNLACNADLGIDNTSDLVEKKPKIAIGKMGSGSWVSWNGLVYADKTEGSDEYSAIPTDNGSGALALTQTVDGSDVGCMFYTISGNSEFGFKVKDAAAKGTVLKFVDLHDKDFNDTVDAKGKSIYEPTEVDYGQGGFFGGSRVGTYSVSAVFYVSDSWAAANPDSFNDTVTAFLPTVTNLKALRKLP